jgi:hypothetical protein
MAAINSNIIYVSVGAAAFSFAGVENLAAYY